MVMGMDFGWWFWPFGVALVGAWIIVAVLFLIFWIWMIVDGAKRHFMTDVEKIIWIIVIVLGGIIGALVYFIVIRQFNPKGIYNSSGRSRRR